MNYNTRNDFLSVAKDFGSLGDATYIQKCQIELPDKEVELARPTARHRSSNRNCKIIVLRSFHFTH